jgi:secretion/DNA translocation related TadE-like protein
MSRLRDGRDRGATSVVTLICCAILGVGALILGATAAAASVSARTQSAADLAALAAAGALLDLHPDPCAVATATAVRNGGVLLSCSLLPAAVPGGAEVAVAVRRRTQMPFLGSVDARARAGLREPGAARGERQVRP